MDSPPDFPTLDDAPPRSRWQFSLGMLMWFFTVAAVIAALFRFTAAHPCVSVLLIGCLVLLCIYAIVWLPMIFAQLQRIREHRRKLLEWTNKRREAARRERVSGEE